MPLSILFHVKIADTRKGRALIMTDLRRSFFGVALYLLVILTLGLLDRAGTPIINFAAYFYLIAIFCVTVMVFVPSLHKVTVVVPMVFWGAIYFALLRLTDRSHTASTAVEVVLLELVLLEGGVWLSYRLAVAIDRSESLMDLLAHGTFPHRAVEMDEASDVIKTEFSRSRRYHRPLALLFVNPLPKDEEAVREMLKSLQRDMLSRLSNARIGQAISGVIRQTDLLIRDHAGAFVILCPETNLESAGLLASRIQIAVEDKTGLNIRCGVASFPDEALTFDDLLYAARERSQRAELAKSLENVN